ncbi:DUF6777 domain-containing protein [Streptomyces sp. NPDC085927]|uniref:DUF6777 domain-containing protein n=1 Tax=Streptomyces sp. NPDC085927 TaxID=3365738 RepID=UPI0037D5AF75
MTVEPPSSGRPSGPPSGPLSDSSPPPSSGPPPPPPPGGAGGGDGGGGTGPPGRGRRPWWRSVPGLGVLVAAMAVAVVLAVVLTRTDGGSEAGGGEVFLQAANAAGPDPFTESTAEDGSAPPTASAPPTTGAPSTGSASESSPATEVRGVRGGAPGLYGGTRDVSSCDVEQQIKYLREVPAKNEAFASVAGVESSEVPSYLRSLTPLQLRLDTRVTNHGYRDGAATEYQAVLQAGTAVLVDARGVPRVRCACGNPLTEPVEQSDPRYTGTPWPGYSPSKAVVVDPAPRDIERFVVRDTDGGWFERERGDTGGKDRPTKPPDGQSPQPGDTSPSPSPDTSPSATPSTPGSGPTTGGGEPSGEPPSSDPGGSDPTTGGPTSGPRTPPPVESGTTNDAPDSTADNGTGGLTGDATSGTT